MIERDPVEGMWLTLHQPGTTRWVIARIESRDTHDALTIVATDHLPPMQSPRLAVRRDGICLYDFTGQYLANDRTLQSWRRVELPLDALNEHFTLHDVTWFAYNGTQPGRRGGPQSAQAKRRRCQRVGFRRRDPAPLGGTVGRRGDGARADRGRG